MSTAPFKRIPRGEKDIPPEHKDRKVLISCSRLWDPRFIPQTGENLTEGHF